MSKVVVIFLLLLLVTFCVSKTCVVCTDNSNSGRCGPETYPEAEYVIYGSMREAVELCESNPAWYDLDVGGAYEEKMKV